MNRAFAIVPLAAMAVVGLASTRQRGPAPSRPLYTVRDLGTLGGASSAALGINNDGQVVGRAETDRGTEHAFLYNGGKMTDLAPESLSSSACAISDAGRVVFSDSDADRMHSRPHLYESRTRATTHLFPFHGDGTERGASGGAGMLVAAPGLYVNGINEAGQIVGISRFSGKPLPHAFLWHGGAAVDLGDFGGGGSRAWAINPSGQVVGYAQTPGLDRHAFLYRQGQMQDLGTLGGRNSCAYAISDCGLVVGEAETSAYAVEHAFLAMDGRMCDLGSLDGPLSGRKDPPSTGCAYGVNNFAEIVGSSWVGNNERAFFWDPAHRMRDLNRLLPVSSGWALERATAINERGQIVGLGVTDNHTHAFLLTPRRGN